MEIECISHTASVLEDVITLGKANSKTLGLFPRDAFIEHAKKRWIIVAKANNRIIGYLLFRITASTGLVNITHLCIDSDYRNQGVAVKLLDFLKQKYQYTHRGLVLNCREDYMEASRFWENYGFKSAAEKASRSKQNKKLIRWFYDFGNADLFTSSYINSAKVNAVLDSNTLFKLSDDQSDERVSLLLADWLNDDVEYFFAPEIYNEIKRDDNQSRRNKTRAFLNGFSELKFNPKERDGIYSDINEIIPGNTVNDKSDKLQVAETIASGIAYFITLDKRLISVSDVIHEKYSVRILRPIDFILLLDALKNANDYQAYRVAGARYEYHKITAREIDSLVESFLQPGEKKHTLRERLSSTASNTGTSQIKIVKDSSSKHIGFFAFDIVQNTVAVRVLRTIKHRISSTLCSQMLYDITQHTIKNGCYRITVDDPYISLENKDVLRTYKFDEQTICYQKILINDVCLARDLFKNPVFVENFDAQTITSKVQQYVPQARDMYLFQLERVLWPLKIADINIPVYIVPIKPYWAGQLFDYYISNNSLFGAKPELAWSKENVYYRSIRPISEKTPARILWYVSSASNLKVGREQGIVATSYLDEVEVGDAKNIFNRYRNFGIYTWSDISSLAAKNPNNEIKILKFSDTEIFTNAVPLDKIRAIFQKNGQAENTFASPVRVNNAIFLEIYRLGKDS